MKNVPVDLRRFHLTVGLIPAADEVDHDMEQASNDQKPKQLFIGDVAFNAVEDVFGQIDEEKYIEDLLDAILE